MTRASAIIKAYAEQQKGRAIPCPRCGRPNMNEKLCMNALSRRAQIYICSDCGTAEAFEDYLGCHSSIESWKIVQLCRIRKEV